ncbi:MAG TPA: DoxX family protein [Mesorhizobium sp.]|nr:DoxX family protein [Mesorhizobium sp.]
MSLLEQIVIWSLAAIFVGSAGLNLTGPDFVREEFEKWGYPSWLRFAVATMEVAAAVLLVVPATRSLGALLALAILVAVVFSLGRTREWLRMQFPLLMGALCVGLLT